MEVGPKVIIRAPDKSIAQRSRKLLPSLHDSGADLSNGCQGSTLSPVSLGARRAVSPAPHPLPQLARLCSLWILFPPLANPESPISSGAWVKTKHAQWTSKEHRFCGAPLHFPGHLGWSPGYES